MDWVVVNCVNDEAVRGFSTRAEAEHWVKSHMGSERLILYPHGDYRILSADEVREIETSGALITDDFGESNVWR